jgi:hypothetical protein
MATDAGRVNIRQMCMKLRPILGNRADQIFAAHMAEDDIGKGQIEQYVQQLTAKYLPTDLSDNSTVLIPPSKEQAAGEYDIGKVQYAGRELYDFGLREDEWIQHLAILGRSGAGKTNIGFLILDELKKKDKPFLLFDWKRNYRDMLALKEFKDVEVYTIGRSIAPFTFNPLIPPQGTDPKTWLKKLNQIIAHSYCLGNGCLFLLQQAVDAVYEEAGVYDGTVEKWPTFQAVMTKARGMDSRGRESGWLSSTLRALATLCFGDMDTLLNTNSNRSIDHILDKNVILELDALTQSDKTFFVQAAMLYLHHQKMADGKREQFASTVVLEEAHHVLSDERRSFVGGQSVMDIIFREIREFGVSLILLDQHPSKISLSALGNSYCTICMNLKHKSDINAMAQCMLLDKDKDVLGSLNVGEAVVKLQGRIARPFQIKIPHFVIEKGRITDSDVKARMKHLAPATVEQDFRLPSGTIATPPAPSGRKGDLILSFLEDIQTHPDSGIANRYRRLNLSVRQGQKLKTQVLEKGLTTEHTGSTPTGRIKLIHLTDKAKALLAEE